MKKLVELIEMKLLDIRVQIEQLEKTDTMSFTTAEWKSLHSKREMLAEILAEARK